MSEDGGRAGNREPGSAAREQADALPAANAGVPPNRAGREATNDAVPSPDSASPKSGPPPLASAPLAYENPTFVNGPDGRLIRLVAEYLEPLARFRHEQIQDTVVFFGSARFRGREEADHELELLANTGSQQAAPSHEQPASIPDIAAGTATDLQRKRAVAAVEMARYYEDARRLSCMFTKWASKIP